MGFLDLLKKTNAKDLEEPLPRTSSGDNIAKRTSQIVRSIIPKVNKSSQDLYLAAGSGPGFKRRELYLGTSKPKLSTKQLYFGNPQKSSGISSRGTQGTQLNLNKLKDASMKGLKKK